MFSRSVGRGAAECGAGAGPGVLVVETGFLTYRRGCPTRCQMLVKDEAVGICVWVRSADERLWTDAVVSPPRLELTGCCTCSCSKPGDCVWCGGVGIAASSLSQAPGCLCAPPDLTPALCEFAVAWFGS